MRKIAKQNKAREERQRARDHWRNELSPLPRATTDKLFRDLVSVLGASEDTVSLVVKGASLAALWRHMVKLKRAQPTVAERRSAMRKIHRSATALLQVADDPEVMGAVAPEILAHFFDWGDRTFMTDLRMLVVHVESRARSAKPKGRRESRRAAMLARPFAERFAELFPAWRVSAAPASHFYRALACVYEAAGVVVDLRYEITKVLPAKKGRSPA